MDHPLVTATQTQTRGESVELSSSYEAWTQALIRRTQVENEGDALAKAGRYQEALARYEMAMNPPFIVKEDDKTSPIGNIKRIHKILGNYEKAREYLQWFINRNPHGTGWLDEKLELEALIRARDTGSMQPVYEHIAYLRKKYKNQLPPKGCPAGICDIIASTIIRLYDVIGDFDSGIAFVEEFLKFYAKIGPGNPYQPANPHYQIKQAFLQDKAEGRGSCLGMAPNDQCPGRATRALIKSDYFPW